MRLPTLLALAFLLSAGSPTRIAISFSPGNLTFDVLPPRNGKPRPVTPFLVTGGGFFQHRDRFGPFGFTSYEGAFTAGGGVRGWVTDRVYALADVRFGWELHARVNAGIGIGL